VARVRVGSEAPVNQLVCHPRLPLIAGLDSERPAVHVWDCGAGQLDELGTAGADSPADGDAVGWERRQQTPAAAWHPDQPLLVVASRGAVVRWTPAGLTELSGLPPAAAYRSLAFSPDGQTLWASPSSSDAETAWESSDCVDLASGTIRAGPRWDTEIATHPAGGLVTTLCSDQNATLGVFARVDQDSTPAAIVAGHDVLAGSPVTALGATAAGDLAVASGGGDLALVSVPASSPTAHAVCGDTSRAMITAFLDATSEVPGDGDLETHLVLTDGARTWHPGDLAAVTTATTTDPAWLQLRAAVNTVFGQPR